MGNFVAARNVDFQSFILVQSKATSHPIHAVKGPESRPDACHLAILRWIGGLRTLPDTPPDLEVRGRESASGYFTSQSSRRFPHIRLGSRDSAGDYPQPVRRHIDNRNGQYS
jgi:hypothetical protein